MKSCDHKLFREGLHALIYLRCIVTYNLHNFNYIYLIITYITSKVLVLLLHFIQLFLLYLHLLLEITIFNLHLATQSAPDGK